MAPFSPGSAARPDFLRNPAPLPRGLDAWAHRLAGHWHRRPSVVRRLLSQAGEAMSRESECAALSPNRLREVLRGHREALQRRPDTGWPTLATAALAALREIFRRETGLAAHLEQLAAVLGLRQGCLLEMATGEGKSLVGALAAVTFAWEGRPCHLLTVNDYLAERDAVRFGPAFHACGLRAAPVLSAHGPDERRAGHAAAITYTTARELLADFLRDRLLPPPAQPGPRGFLQSRLAAALDPARPIPQPVLRGLHTVLIDEADSILIDEAVTPLLLSQPRPNPGLNEAVLLAGTLARELQPGRDYRCDPRFREIDLTPAGRARLADLVGALAREGLWSGTRRREELVLQALHAREFFQPGRDYAVQAGKIVIVDEFTGRAMPQRSWREGLHQAIEAREGVPLTPPADTVGRMSFQHFFRLVPRLCGLTGTARENAAELWHVFRLPVLTLPRHRPLRLRRLPTRAFATAPEKWNALVEEIHALHRRGQPVLVGLRSIAASEALSARLRAEGLPHHVLHALRHSEEAFIVSQAGASGRITLATNMAGRGTDIRLDPGVDVLGGLHVLATEWHEAARIDRQLFGRCARQGDPGSCRLCFSLDDELLQRFLPPVAHPLLRLLLSARLPSAQILARGAARAAQFAAENQSRRRRAAVLRADNALRQSLPFTLEKGGRP